MAIIAAERSYCISEEGCLSPEQDFVSGPQITVAGKRAMNLGEWRARRLPTISADPGKLGTGVALQSATPADVQY